MSARSKANSKEMEEKKQVQQLIKNVCNDQKNAEREKKQIQRRKEKINNLK
jgi:hypothetical protein